MACNTYTNIKSDSQKSTKNFLVAKTIIDKFNKILDFTKWSNEAGRLNKIAKDTYNLSENILSSEQQGKVASFNKPMFDEIDRQKNNKQLSKKQVLKNTIEKDLPIEISKAITIVDEVPLDILGRNDLFLSLKDILTENGVTDELLINWLGINKDKVDVNPNIIHYNKAIETIIQKVYNKKKIESNYIEFKTNKLAKESFYKWIEALEKYPIAFQDAMLTHALKWLNNPVRREKYVLQLSEVALQNAYGMVVNKPYELNRIGKLYDKEVLSVVSDAVEHEPSASGRGYWVHIPRTKSGSSTKFDNFYVAQYNNGYEITNGFGQYAYYKSEQEAETKLKELRKNELSSQSSQYKANVDLLRKLSPSTWCTSGSMTEHYVQNYDNYLLIVDGITVVGIESTGESNTKETLTNTILYEQKLLELNEKLKENKYLVNNSDYIKDYLVGINRTEFQGDINYNVIDKSKYQSYPFPKSIKLGITEKRFTDENLAMEYFSNQEKIASQNISKIIDYLKAEIFKNEEELKIIKEIIEENKSKVPKIKVKEVTSRNNNGVASIDHLDDTIAFFEKHNLDLDNPTIKLAIQNRDLERTDNDFKKEEIVFNWGDLADEAEDRGDVDDPGLEYRRQEEEYYDMQIAENMNLEEAFRHLNLGGFIPGNYYRLLPQEVQNNEQIARNAVEFDAHNIVFVPFNLPFYNELVVMAMQNRPSIYEYLTDREKSMPEVQQIYIRYVMERDNLANANDIIWADDLPFSKTVNRLIQGYYDSFKDKVVIVANNTSVNEISKIALHEVAHRGIVRMAKDLGGTKELNQILLNSEKELMKKLPELLKRTGHKNLEELLRDYGFDVNTEEGKIKLLVELAARWAETFHNKIKPSWWKEFLQSIQKWITKFTGKILNENEVNELVGGFVKYGTQNITQQPIKKVKQNPEETLNLAEQKNHCKL